MILIKNEIKTGADILSNRCLSLIQVDTSNPAQFSVLGGTGIFKNAGREALEIMTGPNRSGAFNVKIDLSGLSNVPVGDLKQLINGE